jgi:hypothetical protein
MRSHTRQCKITICVMRLAISCHRAVSGFSVWLESDLKCEKCVGGGGVVVLPAGTRLLKRSIAVDFVCRSVQVITRLRRVASNRGLCVLKEL